MELIYHGKHNRNISGAERVASVIAGSLLAYTGIKRKSVAGYALAAIGGDLVRRGCPHGDLAGPLLTSARQTPERWPFHVMGWTPPDGICVPR